MADKNIGTVVQIIGAVLDIRFLCRTTFHAAYGSVTIFRAAGTGGCGGHRGVSCGSGVAEGISRGGAGSKGDAEGGNKNRSADRVKIAHRKYLSRQRAAL
ncbi:hypothetical protein [uncultured Corynebacterium sp.]|uniref:hypothetical protein n=1 Tax=uncultured Corynebacterium sp. TaxID=159447 RepID=UPI0025FCDF0C|nr:hypothetical protein [uncultured Corynebacterium sp.]